MTREQERFLAKVDTTSDCWIWKGGIRIDGYGHSRKDGKWIHAHRFSHLLFCGEIPEDRVVHHVCEIKRCVRPSHLALVTPTEHKRIHRKSACGKGHPFDALNTYLRPDGQRDCRTCIRGRTACYRRRLLERSTVT